MGEAAVGAGEYRPPPDEGLEILYADARLVVVVKPPGLLSVPGRGEDKADCLVSRLRRDYPDVLIVHRLDMATSGLLVLARDSDCHRLLSRFFAERRVGKRYLALVSGRPVPETGQVDLPLITDWPNRPRQKVDFERGKPSLTRYRLLDHDPRADVSRVALEPETGRSHQLRLHMASLGHPILGDDLYGGAPAPRLMLHAEVLDFPDPENGCSLRFESPAAF